MEGKMKAQVFYDKEDMRLEMVDIPQLKPDEVLIKVRAVGVCGSDLAYYFGKTPLDTENGKGPLIMGHEFCGDIVELGAAVKDDGNYKEGDRVVVNPAQVCYSCPQCKKFEFNLCQHIHQAGTGVNGAYAEYVKIKYNNLFHMPDHMTYEEGAICEPVACATHGVSKLEVQTSDTVAIIGPGNIGLMMCQLIKSKGPEKIIMVGVVDYGLEKAKEFGADYVFNTMDKNSPYYTDDIAKSVREVTGGQMANKVIVPTAAISALEQALDISGYHAVITYFGMPKPSDMLSVPMMKAIMMEKTLKTSWLAPDSWTDAISAVANKKIRADKLVTNRFKLEEVEDAIRFMADPSKPEKIKSVILMD